MATAAFKSNSRRSNGYMPGDSPKTRPSNQNPPPQKRRLRRSLSVNALSRSSEIDISSEFLKRDNPLFWATGGSPAGNNTETPTPIAVACGASLESGVPKSSNVAVGQRGRSATRNSDLRNASQKEEVVGRRRSSSRVIHNGGNNRIDRRGRSVSRAKLPSGASESEAEQEPQIPITYGGRTRSIRASNRTGTLPVSGVKSCHVRSSHQSVGSSVDSQISNWEDGISTSSLSEAEEKTIKAVYEQMKSFESDNSRKDTASSEIYETVRSEVRRAIADIQDDLHQVIRRNSAGTLISRDVTSKLVKPEADELVFDIRREYAKELEEAQERTRKLRSDLAIEEHRKLELSRILKVTLPEPKSSVSYRSRLGRKSSSERKKMSKCLTDEAMSYFDECVSISTFDSSDFSAAEEPAVSSVAADLATGAATSLAQDARFITPFSGPNRCIDQQTIDGDTGTGSCSTVDGLSEKTGNVERERKSVFSFGHKPTESVELQHGIQNYIKAFEKDSRLTLEGSRAHYSPDAYDVNESLLFDKVFYRNRQDSGNLHICGGGSVSVFPFAASF